MSRPLFNSSIVELEALFQRGQNDPLCLRGLASELEFRKTPKAVQLRNAVQDRIRVLSKDCQTDSSEVSAPETSAIQNPPASRLPERAQSGTAWPRFSHGAPPPPITNQPEGILSAWTALEVLSPPTFVRLEDLAGGDRRAIASLEEATLPWERGEKSRPNNRLYYQIVLGTVKMEPAIAALVERFGDARPEKPSGRGRALLAVIIVDKTGSLVESPAVVISSFGWALVRALQGNLSELCNWPQVESQIQQKIEACLRSGKTTDIRDGKQVLTKPALLRCYQTLVNELELPLEFVEPPSFAVRSYTYFKDPNPPEPLLLNSFFLNDLALARQLFAEGKAPANLRRYLGVAAPQQQVDLLRESAALEKCSAPEKTPLARWPGPGRHPLVLLQQAAVNLAFSETQNGGILGINGPPGTGKTTLLRDVVAGVLAERAEAMVQFNDPESAFAHTGEKLRLENSWLHLYRLADSLRGFEMVVASSNNKAVENVSAELPGLGAIAEDATGLRYFKVLSDSIHARQTWGIIAAVLGNAQNRGRFKQDFWWNTDYGFSRYLAAVTGVPQQIEEIDPATGQVRYREPAIITAESPPLSHEEALRRWDLARRRFRGVAAKSKELQTWLAKVRTAMLQVAQLVETEAQSQRSLETAIEAQTFAQQTLEAARVRLPEVEGEKHLAHSACIDHDLTKPGFFARLFRTAAALYWAQKSTELRSALQKAESACRDAQQIIVRSEAANHQAYQFRHKAETALAAAKAAQIEAEKLLNEARQKAGIVLPDADFFSQDHRSKQTATLWYSPEAQRVRDEVFIAAVEVHRAFIDAAAKPLRHNLGVMMTIFSTQTLPTAGKQALLPSLWASLFLVVPLVSTTFASVDRMLSRLPCESLGWLLVDEAGQALPQAAVGALLRTRRAVVVGDPMQIEPVVTLPEVLTKAICRQFGVDPDQYSAPAASVQTLADAASGYATEFESRLGSRRTGVPLLVHRRCHEPMFSVSNAIAYSNLMVFAKAPKSSPIRDVLGPSTWFDVVGTMEDKWCPQEGEHLLVLLRRLALAKVNPDLYIVTPFVIVADRIRQLVRESRLLETWVPDVDPWKWTYERIGTVHTVQGREAEAVIFVLGAPSSNQTGARNWAGGRPNLMNVAVTRAKEVIYIVGNRDLWMRAGVFEQLHLRMPNS